MKKEVEGLLKLIELSPTAFHACDTISNILTQLGYTKINEANPYNIKLGGKYFVTRNNSSVIAFEIPNDITDLSFNITAAHLDSPTFKLKPNFTIDNNRYKELNIEVYGGPILSTWFDRPLDIAGRVMIKNDNGIETKLIRFSRPMAIIPNCSIHYNRELNSGYKYNPQTDLMPIFSDNSNSNILLEIAKKLNANESDILSYDLYLALLDRGMVCGTDESFISAPQLDNLACAYACLKALSISEPLNGSINVMALFDNEEIGSTTRQGANSSYLEEVLYRCCKSLGLKDEGYYQALANSFIISADNAQAFHPNYAAKYDQTNKVFMNDGIVIKSAARGSYSSDAFSIAYFKAICDDVAAKYQMNTNRSDTPGGSTLGAISQSHVSIPSVDIGLPQIAMHSAYETMGIDDLNEMIKALQNFYSKHISLKEDGKVEF